MRIPRFTFGTESWACRLPMRAWAPADSTIGGRRVSGAGIPASFVARRDNLLAVTVRLGEDELEQLLALVAYGQTGATLTWEPDPSVDAAFTVYLEEPAPGTRWSPTRAEDYPRAFEQTLVLRAQPGDSLWLQFFDTVGWILS